MATFTYQARDTAGKVVSGQVEAADEAAAALQLVSRDLIVTTLKAGGAAKPAAKRRQGKVKSQDLVEIGRAHV